MVVCFECSAEVQTALQQLLQRGYTSRSEAICSAILNLAVIQNQIVRGGDAIELGTNTRQSRPSRRQSTPPTGAPSDDDNHQTCLNSSIPPVFLLRGIRGEQIKTEPSISAASSELIEGLSLKQWLFGQYNKFLPVKANCRALAHLTLAAPTGVSLGDASRAIARDAVKLGQFLQRIDKERSASKDDALATAFPINGKDPEKGLIRYSQHFVGMHSGARQVTGFLADLRLIKSTYDPLERVLLTEAALHFALLPNPALDGLSGEQSDLDTSLKFTGEEQSFLLQHIESSVPTERLAYKAIVNAVSSGANSPEKVDAWLTSHIDTSETAISPGFVATQRSGAISRMADLGLIARRREGLRVTYALTEAANALF
jgi:hypothetical protein